MQRYLDSSTCVCDIILSVLASVYCTDLRCSLAQCRVGFRLPFANVHLISFDYVANESDHADLGAGVAKPHCKMFLTWVPPQKSPTDMSLNAVHINLIETIRSRASGITGTMSDDVEGAS